jgi:hypothetical protein
MFKTIKNGNSVILMKGTQIVGMVPVQAVLSNMKDEITDLCAGGFQCRASTGFSVVKDGNGVKIDFFNRVIPMKSVPNSELEILKQCYVIEEIRKSEVEAVSAERDQLKKDNALLLDALQSLQKAFQHDGNGKTKGNQAKTDIIKYNEDVRIALVNVRETIDYKLGK